METPAVQGMAPWLKAGWSPGACNQCWPGRLAEESENCASAFERWQETDFEGSVSKCGHWQETEFEGCVSAFGEG